VPAAAGCPCWPAVGGATKGGARCRARLAGLVCPCTKDILTSIRITMLGGWRGGHSLCLLSAPAPRRPLQNARSSGAAAAAGARARPAAAKEVCSAYVICSGKRGWLHMSVFVNTAAEHSANECEPRARPLPQSGAHRVIAGQYIYTLQQPCSMWWVAGAGARAAAAAARRARSRPARCKRHPPSWPCLLKAGGVSTCWSTGGGAGGCCAAQHKAHLGAFAAILPLRLALRAHRQACGAGAHLVQGSCEPTLTL
jgi:hypothetical protein